MNYVIITLSGTPGTGKTRLAKAISNRFKLNYLSLTTLISKKKLFDSYDKRRKCYIVDEKKLVRYLISHIKEYSRLPSNTYMEIQSKKLVKDIKSYLRELEEKKVPIKQPYRKKSTLGIVIDGHLSHFLPKSFVELCIITKTDLGTLKKRLNKRKYGKQKVFENLQAEIFDTCFEEAKKAKHDVIVFHN